MCSRDFNVDCYKMMYDKNLRLLREFINDYNFEHFYRAFTCSR